MFLRSCDCTAQSPKSKELLPFFDAKTAGLAGCVDSGRLGGAVFDISLPDLELHTYTYSISPVH